MEVGRTLASFDHTTDRRPSRTSNGGDHGSGRTDPSRCVRLVAPSIELPPHSRSADSGLLCALGGVVPLATTDGVLYIQVG